MESDIVVDTIDTNYVRNKLFRIKNDIHEKISEYNKLIFSNGDHLSFFNYDIIKQTYNSDREAVWFRSKRNISIIGELEKDERVKIYIVDGYIYSNNHQRKFLASECIKLNGDISFNFDISSDARLIIDLKNISFEQLFINQIY